uniref:Uncharacterized protein n=1 Tax=Arundo donax TaxID=35708 RepID=A0A0A9DL61_ARUDO
MEGRAPPSVPSRPLGKKVPATSAASGSAATAAVGMSSAAPSAGAASAGRWPTRTSPSGADSSQWIPPGGFMNLLQHPKFLPFTQGPYRPENFHFVGGISQFSPPPAPYGKGTLSPSDPSDKVTPSEKKKQKATSETKQKLRLMKRMMMTGLVGRENIGPMKRKSDGPMLG